MEKITKESKYKELKFKSDKKLKEWLSKTAHLAIHLQDNGQDLQVLWVDKEGEILHTNAQSSNLDGKVYRYGTACVRISRWYMLSAGQWNDHWILSLKK
jgi:hypothetical protein